MLNIIMTDSKKNSSSSNDGKDTPPKPNPLDALLQHESFQAIQKLMSKGSFCDPFRPEEDESTPRSAFLEDSIPEKQERTSSEQTNTKVTIITSANVVEGQGWNKNVLCVSPDNSSSFSSPSPQLWNSIFRSEIMPTNAAEGTTTINNETSSTADPDMIVAPSETFENEFELQLPSDSTGEYDFLSLARSASTEAGDDIQPAEAHTPKGAPQSPKVTFPLEEVVIVTTPRSSTWKILTFVLLWSTAFFAALFVHPESGYDRNWLEETFENTQVTLQAQVKECDRYILQGNRDTNCALQKLHTAAQLEMQKCRAYANGESDTLCFAQVSAQVLTNQVDRLATSLQETANSVQTTCTRDNAQAMVSPVQEWTVQMVGQLQDRVHQEYVACEDFLMNSHTGTTCSLERIHIQWKEQRDRTQVQLQQLQDRAHQEYKVCQSYLGGQETTGADCSLERVQLEWKRQTQMAMDKFKETQAMLLEHQAQCQSYLVAGQTGTDCLLEHATIQWVHQREWMSSKAVELQKRIKVEASAFQEHLKDTHTQPSQPQDVVIAEEDGVADAELDQEEDSDADAVADLGEQEQNPTDDIKSLIREEISSDSYLADSYLAEEDAGEVPATMQDKGIGQASTVEDRRKFAESYFEKLDPIPVAQVSQQPSQGVSAEEAEGEADKEDEFEMRTQDQDTVFVSENENAEIPGDERGIISSAKATMKASTGAEESLDENPAQIVAKESEDIPLEESTNSDEEDQGNGKPLVDEEEPSLRREETPPSLEDSPVVAEPATQDGGETIASDGENMIKYVKLEHDANGKPFMVRMGKKMEPEKSREKKHRSRISNTLKAFFGRN